jgi:hypothetical protein
LVQEAIDKVRERRGRTQESEEGRREEGGRRDQVKRGKGGGQEKREGEQEKKGAEEGERRGEKADRRILLTFVLQESMDNITVVLIFFNWKK